MCTSVRSRLLATQFGGTRFRTIAPLVAGLLLAAAPGAKAADVTWGANGNSEWYTATNWLSGTQFPGLQGIATSNTDIATFTVILWERPPASTRVSRV